MNLPWQTRGLLAVASGAGLALSFPNYNLPLLAWFSVGMLTLASCGARPATAPLYGFLHALIFYPLCIPWMDQVMYQYGDVDPWIAAGILLLVALVCGIAAAIFTWGVAIASKKSKELACMLAPFLWVAGEFARTHYPIVGFPWNLAGYAASGNIAFLQLTPVTGICGLSFVIAAYSSLLVYAALTWAAPAWKWVLGATATLILIATVGGHFVPQPSAPQYVVHLVQTNFPQSEHYPANWLDMHAGELDDLERISVDAAEKTPGLIVWPEVPAPFSLQEPAFTARATRIARASKGDFLVGVVDWKQDSAGEWLATNSAVLLDASGQRVSSYDKIHLAPFGEYVPLRQWLGFAHKLTADISDFTPGTAYRVGRLRGGKFGVFICFEAIFPDEVRQFTKGGAELLINTSNDGWFGRSSAPAQHLMIARVRAAENRRWLLRDTNNGFTVSVDPYGRIVASMATDVRGELDAPYDFRTDLTPYVRFGDWFAWLCVFASFMFVGMAIGKGKREAARTTTIKDRKRN